MYEGEEMRDIENKVLEKYWVDVNSVRRVRGGFLCETKQGLLRLKELSSSDKKIPYVQFLCQQLTEAGFETIDMMLLNKEGNYVCDMQHGGKYVLKKWYMGRECDIHREKEVLYGCRTLARLHNHMEMVSNQLVQMEDMGVMDERWQQFQGSNLIEEWTRHNKGLKKARSYMRHRVGKGPFEKLYLNKFEEIYETAGGVVTRMQSSGYEELFDHAVSQKLLVHGDYNYHNILFVGPYTAVTNFERFRIDLPIADLYYFLRKVMEKCDWDEGLGKKMLEAYANEREITDAEYEYIALRLSYPEKVWKLINCYYNTSKAWIPQKNVEKLEISIKQMPIKQQFVQHIFSFHL